MDVAGCVVNTKQRNRHHNLVDMHLDKKVVFIVKYLWIMKEIIVLVAIDNYDACLEVEKGRTSTYHKAYDKKLNRFNLI